MLLPAFTPKWTTGEFGALNYDFLTERVSVKRIQALSFFQVHVGLEKVLNSGSDPHRKAASSRGCVLIVEDDPEGLCYFETSLRTAGFNTLGAKGAGEAESLCRQHGFPRIDAVLTDFRMPEKTGLELLQWIQENDSSLATVVVTAQGEKELVKRTLDLGGAGFLEKPILHKPLVEAMERAVVRTRRQRQIISSARELDDASMVDHQLNNYIPKGLRERFRLRYLPLHKMGGDFLNVWQLEDSERVMVLIGDVSGHDLRAAYVAAYFQGIFRGHAESGRALEASLTSFNNQLIREADVVPSTLAMSWFEIDHRRQILTVYSCGFPPFVLSDEHGFVRRGALGTHPLGWFENLPLAKQEVPLEKAVFLLMFTDGVVDYADQLGIDPLSLAYRLAHGGLPAGSSSPPPDDILSLTYQIQPNIPVKEVFEPIIDEQYSGAEYVHVDNLQSVWRRSLQYALEEELIGDRLYDLLICIREGMLNALIHGCAGSSEKFCHLLISYNREAQCIRVRIDDPGKGHNFRISERLRDLDNLPEGRQLGLGIVQHLSDEFNIENKGTSLVFDFYITPQKEPA